MTLQELRDLRTTAANAAATIVETAEKENRGLTDEQKSAFDGHVAEVERLDGEIRTAEKAAELRASITEPTDPTVPKPRPNAPDVVVRKEHRPFSVVRAMAAMDSGRSLGSDEAYHSDAIADYLGKESRGFYIPMDATVMTVSEQHKFHADLRSKDSSLMAEIEMREIGKVAPTTSAAAIVATDLLVDRFIEMLTPASTIGALGATFIPGLVGDADIPRKATGATAGWISTEGGDSGNSEMTLDSIPLTPKTIANHQGFTRRTIKQTTPGIENLVREDNLRAVAEGMDRAAVIGTGANGEPQGIMLKSGIGSVTLTNPITWAQIVEFETDLNTANVRADGRGFLLTPPIQGTLKSTVKEATAGTGYLMDADGRVMGYPSRVSSNGVTNNILFGAWPELIVAMWGVVDAMVDPYTKARSGGVILHIFQDADIQVRHNVAFSAGQIV